jgi:ribosomal-protein-alanine N-acetyltransferase
VSAETGFHHPAGQTVRRLDLADLEACLNLDQAALEGLWTREQWHKELEDLRRPCLGVLESGQLLALACGWLVVDELHITAVAASPQRRREGLGQRVLQALLAEATQQGAKHATLEVSATNQAANALYARCGFRTAGIRHGYYRNGDDALIQWLRLQDTEEVRIAGHS